MNEILEGFADAICVHTEIRIGWSERLRMLVHGTVFVRTEVLTEHAPGRTRPRDTEVTIPPIRRRKPCLMVGHEQVLAES